jgi:periplasmic protein TonB
MFDDFRPSSQATAARKRLGGSLAAAAILYGAIGALVIVGTGAATKTVVEKLTQVEFAAPPPPPPPPQVLPQAIANARPKAKRRELKPPSTVPDQKPRESDSPPVSAGPVDGFLTGVEGGQGGSGVAPAAPPPPPPPKPEPLIAPVALRGNSAPGYSASARRKQIEGVVVVAFDVLENGTVANAQIVSGPEELRDNVLRAVVTWRFEPARQGGRPVRSRQTRSIRFRLTDI